MKKTKKEPAAHPQWAVMFRKPGTELRYLKGNYYLYEVSSFYDPLTKKTRKKTGKLLGRITENDGLISSPIRLLYRKVEQPVDFTSIEVKEWGFTLFLLQGVEVVTAALKQHFPQHWQQLLQIAYCRLLYQSPIKNMPFHLSKSMLAHQFNSALTDKKITEVLRHTGRQREKITAYMQSFIKPNDYVLADMTNLFTNSSQISLAKEGYNSDMVFDKQFNLLYIYSPALLLPVFYRLLAGNIREVKGFQICLKESGIKEAVIIADKGFYSAENIKLLEGHKLHYIIPLKRDSSLIDYSYTEKKEGHYFKFSDRYIWYGSYQVEEARNIFIFRDDKLRVQEEKDYLDRIEKLPEEYSLEKYHHNRERFGTIALITNLKEQDAAKLFMIYKSRNEIEVMFDGMKNVLDADKTYMQNEEALQGWMFVNHIALQCYYIMYNLLKQNELLKKHSVNEVMLHLKEIKKVHINDEWITEPITHKTKKLLQKMKLSVTYQI